MPVDLTKLAQDKETIISFVNSKGPSLPIHIAKAANLNVLFASAFLSELYAEGRIKMSHMKVGSSSLYFLSGQEAQLENFQEYLNPKEKEALHLLKDSKLLEDEQQVPAIRVALRALKDFAIPLKVRLNEVQKIFWKYYMLKDNEAQILLENLEQPVKNKEISVKPVNEIKTPASEGTTQAQQQTQNINITEKPKKERKKIRIENSDFLNNIKSYLHNKDIEIITVLLEKKKEFWAIIRANTAFGKQEYYIIAKDKQKISEKEIDQALERNQSEKMPVLILAPGELDKKAAMRILSLRNIIKFINPVQ